MKRNRKIWPRSEPRSFPARLLPCAWLCLSLCASLALAAQSAEAQASATLETPAKMPSPNAYDLYAQAGVAVVDSEAIGEAATDLYYGQTLKTARLQTLVTKNAKALKLLRQGLTHEYRYPYIKDMDETPEHAHFRELTRLLMLEAELKMRRGDRAGAVACYLEALEFSGQIPTGGGLIPSMVGWACETITRRALWKTIDQLDGRTARSVAARMEELARQRVLISTALREDKRMGVATLPRMVRASDEEHETQLSPHIPQIVENFAGWMDAMMANLQKPYLLQKAVIIPVDPMCQVILPSYQKVGFHEARNFTGDALLTVAMALRAYHGEHKSYPARLDQLVPKNLTAVPADPFGNGEPLRYRIRDEKYLLYSIGPDGQDNEGEAIKDNSRTGVQTYVVAIDSKGDFMAGLNY